MSTDRFCLFIDFSFKSTGELEQVPLCITGINNTGDTCIAGIGNTAEAALPVLATLASWRPFLVNYWPVESILNLNLLAN
jgi:hypothetical protein